MIKLEDVLENPGVSIPLLYKLLLERPPEANISHQSMPTMEAHKKFVLSQPYSAWYLVKAEMQHPILPDALAMHHVGAVYLTKQNEVGVFILKDYHRMGLASQAIAALMTAQPRPCYYANIAPMNQPSHTLFQGLGFELCQLTYRFTPSGGENGRSTTG